MSTQQTDLPSFEHAKRAPLILTLELAEPAQTLFQTLRDRHFPPERNVVPAHVSVFHALPGEQVLAIVKRLRALETERFPVEIEAPFGIGRGVAFRLGAPALLVARAALVRDWAAWLTPQDAQGYRPHVTVQNKVAPEAARATLAQLQARFVAFRTEGVAWRLWRYLGGPWERMERVEFTEPPADGAAGTATEPGRNPGRRPPA